MAPTIGPRLPTAEVLAPTSGRRADRAQLAGAPQLLVTVLVVLSTLDHHLVAKLLLRSLPLWALVVLLVEPAEVRSRRVIPIAVVLFTGWAGASYLWSVDPGATQRRFVDLLITVLVAWVAASRLDFSALRRAVARAFEALVVASYVALLVAPGWSTAPNVDGAPGWHAIFSHKNGLGAAAVIALATFWTERQGRARVLWCLAASVLVIGSQSATALALVAALVAVGCWRRAFSAMREPPSRVGYLLLSFGLVLLAIYLVVAQLDVVTALFGRGVELTGRTDIWAATWAHSLDRPLHGYGFGGVWELAVPPAADIWREIRFTAYHAHSGYLDLLIQVGAVGLVLFVAIVAGTMARAWASGGSAGRWAVAVIAVLCLNAVVESGPFFGSGFTLVVLLACCAVQVRRDPVHVRVPAGTQRARVDPATRTPS